jgi:hypothetical protein
MRRGGKLGKFGEQDHGSSEICRLLRSPLQPFVGRLLSATSDGCESILPKKGQ